MAKPYGIEQVIGLIKSYVEDRLPGRLEQIDSEMNDGITLIVPSAAAYFIQTLNERATNYNPFIFIGFTDPPEVSTAGPDRVKIYRIKIALVIANSGGDANLWKRLLRYQHAFDEIFAAGWDKILRGFSRVELDGVIDPAPPEYPNQQVGIQIRVTIT